MYLRLLVLLFSCIPICASASDKVRISLQPSWLYKVTADPKIKPAVKQIKGGYYFSLFDRQVNLQAKTEYNHIIRHIENETGVQNASEVSVTFSPSYQQVIFHKVTLLRNGKPVSELKPSEIQVVQEETEASDFLYNGMKRAFVVLKNVRKGDDIEYAYSVVGFNPVFDDKYSDRIYFYFDTPICNYFETLITPADRTFYIKSFNGAPNHVEEQQANLRTYHWNNPSLKSWESQEGVPSWFDNTPYVTITEYKTWLDVIRWGIKLFDNYQYELPASLKEKMNEWRKAAAGDKDAFAAKAIHFVQDEVRYLGMEIGLHTHKPHTPAQVYNQLFGDCKDKALLLATILRQENIPAYVALVSTDIRAKLLDLPPSSGVFNHAIVAIERSKDYVYVDATLSSQRGELVNMYIPAYGQALVLADKETTLKTVEPGFLNSTLIIEKINVSLYDSSQFTVKTIYAGGTADNFRSSLAESGEAGLEKDYLEYYDKFFEGIQQADGMAIEEDSMKNEIEVREFYKIPNLVKKNAKGQETFEVSAKPIYDYLPDPKSVLKNAPIAIKFPVSTQYSLTVNMPEVTTMDYEALHIRNEAFQFDFDPVARGREVTLQFSFKTFKDHIPVSLIEQYKKDYEKMVAVTSFEFFVSGSAGSANQSPIQISPGNINWNLVIFALVLVTLLGFALKKLNNFSVETRCAPEYGWPIAGWVVVLGVTLAISCLVRLITFASKDFFNKSLWLTLGDGSLSVLQFAWVTELAFSIIWLCGNIGLFYWFVNRRNIFPRFFIWYLGTLIGGHLLLLLLYSSTGDSNKEYVSQIGADFGSTIVYSLIWGLYVLRSERVRNTFLKSA